MRDVNMGSIRSIDRAIDILQAFTIEKTQLTVDDLSKITKIPNSTVYRILCTLEQRGMVQFDEKLSSYKPGLRLMEFGVFLSSVLDVRNVAEETLFDLHVKTGQTVLMAIKEGNQIIYIFKKEKYEGLKFSSVVGERRPFIYGVLGPALLAFLSNKEIEAILSLPIQQHTPYTVTDKKVILKRLQQVQKDGYYIDTNETTIGVSGIGAPIFGLNREIIAAIGVVGPSIHIDDKLEEIKPMILDASSKISRKMGYR
jgi:IclR family KDG regulon transcriptional repressor